MTKRVVAVVFVLVVALLAGLAVGCGGNTGLSKDTVAQVGDKQITQADLDERISLYGSQSGMSLPEKGSDAYAGFERQILDYMIMHEVVVQKSEALGISVAESDVDEQIDMILQYTFGGDQDRFDEALKEEGLTIEQLKSTIRENVLLDAAYAKVTEDVTTVPDADIEAYFEDNKEMYTEPETRTARHILISPEPASSSTDKSGDAGESAPTTVELTDDDWTAALATAEEVKVRLEDGGDWQELAAEYSDDPGTKETGGDLGTIYKGQMVPEFEEAVFTMAVDAISEPVKTSYGYHIIQLTGINEAAQATLEDEDVKDHITSTLLSEAKTKVWEEWVETSKIELNVTYPGDTESDEAPTNTTAKGADSDLGDDIATPSSESTDTTAKP